MKCKLTNFPLVYLHMIRLKFFFQLQAYIYLNVNFSGVIMSYLLLLLALTSTINGLQNQAENTSDGSDLKPILSIIQRSPDHTTDNQQQIYQVEVKPDQKSTPNQRNNQEIRTGRKSQLPVVSARQHQILQPQYAPVAFIEPQFQYPGFGYVQGKQPISRLVGNSISLLFLFMKT